MSVIRIFPKVDAGIAFPETKRHEYKWPWSKMKRIGDSFRCPLPEGVSIQTMLLRMRSQCTIQGKKFNATLRVRVFGDAVRVWRVKPETK